MAARAAKQAPGWFSAFRRWAYYKSYFPQLGLMRDDCLYETEYVKEALRRLPDDIRAEREFRISRALLLSSNKDILPKDEWMKLEEDTLYLTPIVDQVKKEFREKELWKQR